MKHNPEIMKVFSSRWISGGRIGAKKVDDLGNHAPRWVDAKLDYRRTNIL